MYVKVWRNKCTVHPLNHIGYHIYFDGSLLLIAQALINFCRSSFPLQISLNLSSIFIALAQDVPQLYSILFNVFTTISAPN